MGLFVHTDRTTGIQQAGAAPRGVWTDGLGRAASRAAQVLLLLALVSVSIYALLQVQLVVIPVLIALILAAALSPFIRRLRRKMSSLLAAWVTFLGSLVVLGGVAAVIVLAVQSEWDELTTSAAAGFQQLQSFIQNGPIPVDQGQINEATNSVINFLTSSQFRAGALSGLTVAGQVITGIVLMAVVLFFFLKDGDKIWEFFLRPVKGERLAKARRSGDRTLQVLGGYIRGTAAVALVDAVGIGAALMILQVPLALPLAVVVFIGGFIPMIGAAAAGVLAVLVALVAKGPVVALIVLIVVVVVNQLEGNLLQPILMGRSLSLHGLVILLALTAGTILGGIIGGVLAVPLTAVAWAVIQVWTGDEQPPGELDRELEERTEESRDTRDEREEIGQRT